MTMSEVTSRAVGVYTHRHGTDVSIYPSKELAQLGLVLVLLDNINTGDADDQISLETQKEIVQAYKEGDYEGALETYNRDSDNETMFVTECHDDGVPEPVSADFLEQLDRVLEMKQKEQDDEYEAEQQAQREAGGAVGGPVEPRGQPGRGLLRPGGVVHLQPGDGVLVRDPVQDSPVEERQPRPLLHPEAGRGSRPARQQDPREETNVINGTLRCKKCGNTHTFRGHQSCRGTVAVTVDAVGNFIGNATEDGSFPYGELSFDDPDGPWGCALCDGEVEVVPDTRSPEQVRSDVQAELERLGEGSGVSPG